MHPGADQPPFSKHFDGKRFFNPDAKPVRGFLDLLRWKMKSRREPNESFVADIVPSKPPAAMEGDELRVTLINHSTVLLQQNGLHILTDPIWSERCGPFRWIGPRRHRAPGVRWEDLPRIDIVLISHNHYDHLDIPSLRRLARNPGCQFVVPKRVGKLMKACRVRKPHELDWGQSVQLGGAVIHSVPAMHFSARGLFDRNRSLWCGYVIQAGGRTLYFAGDTGFGVHFAQIRERFGEPRLALLPIGAYKPRWFMSAVHMAPDEAVHAHEILGAKTSLAIHHGTFQLGDEAIDTPRMRLSACAPGESFLTLANGEAVTLT